MVEEKLYPSLRPQSVNDNNLEQRLERHLNALNSFINSINNIKEMKNFYIHESKKYKKLYSTFKRINLITHSLDTLLIIGVTSTTVTLSVTGVGLIVVPIAAGVGASITISSKLISEVLKIKEKTYYKKYQLALKTLEEYNKLLTKSLEDNKIDQNEYKQLKETFSSYKDKQRVFHKSSSKVESFLE